MNRKPDLLLVLTLILGMGILISSYGGTVFRQISIQPTPAVMLAKGLKE